MKTCHQRLCITLEQQCTWHLSSIICSTCLLSVHSSVRRTIIGVNLQRRCRRCPTSYVWQLRICLKRKFAYSPTSCSQIYLITKLRTRLEVSLISSVCWVVNHSTNLTLRREIRNLNLNIIPVIVINIQLNVLRNTSRYLVCLVCSYRHNVVCHRYRDCSRITTTIAINHLVGETVGTSITTCRCVLNNQTVLIIGNHICSKIIVLYRWSRSIQLPSGRILLPKIIQTATHIICSCQN